MPICMEVWGEYASFNSPEMKVERVSYDLMTPSAARGLIESIYWHPGIRWIVDRIHVLAPIRFAISIVRSVLPVSTTICSHTTSLPQDRALSMFFSSFFTIMHWEILMLRPIMASTPSLYRQVIFSDTVVLLYMIPVGAEMSSAGEGFVLYQVFLCF